MRVTPLSIMEISEKFVLALWSRRSCSDKLRQISRQKKQKGNDMNERATERIVREMLDASMLDLEKKGISVHYSEQTSDRKQIKDCLRKASKRGTGEPGYPEFIVTCDNYSDFVMVIECKGDINQHESSDGTSHPEGFAVDGVRHYAKHLSAKFNVLAIAVSGQERSIARVSHFWRFKSDAEDERCFGTKILTLDDYISDYLAHNRVLSQDLNKLESFFHGLNAKLHKLKVPAGDRSLLLSAILMALQEETFKISYEKSQNSEALMSNIVTSLYNYINQSNPTMKMQKCLDTSFAFLNAPGELLESTNLIELVIEIDDNIASFEKTHRYHDLLGNMYIQFLQYSNNDAGLGIVLTPKHITDLAADLVDVGTDDKVLDNCAGTGGFLVSAMKSMLEKAKGDSKQERAIKESVIGVEQQPNIATLLWSNMFLHGDGRSSMIYGNCFDKDVIKQIKQANPTVGLLNPPFKSGRHELEFLKNNLDALVPGGRCAAILPMRCVLNGKNEVALKKVLLENHTLEAVLSLPDELFLDSKVSAVVCLAIFKANFPHGEDKETWLGYCKDDGFVRQKPFGRKDAQGKWDEISKKWKLAYTNRSQQSGFSVMKRISASDDWCSEAYIETDYMSLMDEQCKDEIKNYLIFALSNMIHDEKADIPKLSSSSSSSKKFSDLVEKAGKTFSLAELFDISGTATTKIDELVEFGQGAYPYVTTSSENNATAGWYNHSTEDGGIIAVDSAVRGHASYQPLDFTASDHVEKLSPNFDMSLLRALFFVSPINLNRFRHSYGRKANQERIKNLRVLVPTESTVVDESNSEHRIDFKAIEAYMRSLPYASALEALAKY